ncbi:hypothetical protein OTU49_010311 [Cherax quadricarinatus]|uniref:C2H2-type domain-containing protein n=1 Tax=Cherax quadricarinatus TaxID=27406 RepID=A0AAW0W8R8_CHEQU
MSELHPAPKAPEMSSQAKLSGLNMPDIQPQSTSTGIPIVMSEDVYNGSLDGRQQCFVLVDESTVGVMPEDSTVQRLLTEQEASMSVSSEKRVQVKQIERGKTLEVMHVGNKETVGVMHVQDGRTVEVLHMADGKTVEVVQMDEGKTLEVMHIDAGKHSEVIHVDGSSSIELMSESDPVKRSLTTQSSHDSTALSLRSLAPVNPSIVLSTGKNSLLTGQEFSHMTSTNVSPSIVFSGSKDVLSSSVDSLNNMNNTIIISWSSISPEIENTRATQTDPCNACGPSMNLFFCTFFVDGSVQTQCDMPTKCHASVSTISSAQCRVQPELRNNGDYTDRDPLPHKMEAEERYESDRTDPRFSKSGRILKGKDPLFKLNSGLMDGDQDCDPDFELQGDENDEENTGHQSLAYRKKRGRKRKRRLPSPDDFDEELALVNGVETDGIKTESIIKEEPVDADDDELAMEILKTKGYGLRTKRRPKKLSDMHYMEEKVIKKRIERSQEFSCQMCKKIFPTFSRLQRHAKDEHDSTEFAFPCDLCGVVFTRPHNLERHKDTKHGDGERRFVCEHCGRRFGRQDVLSVHISMVHFKKTLQGKKGPSILGPNTVHCTSCDKFFSKEQKLREHRQGNLTCNDCSISFECKTSLRIHQYKHHPTACNECGKVCDSKQQMYFHRLSHAPKFVCKYCNKGFLWKSQYTVHMATHTGEKNVLCDICGKSFAHKLAVSKHKWQEHNESNKKFKCPTCGKSFVYKGKLQSHVRSHTGEKPFMCHLCPSTFSQRCNLTAHIKSVHGVYIQSIKSDGTTHTQLVKYKRAKKVAPTEPPPAVVNTVIAPPDEPPTTDQPQVAIQEQVQMSESFETEAAVYQIVYAYPQ